MPRRSRRVYLIDGIAFVPHPCARVGLYVKTHACVAQVACPFCKAVIGERHTTRAAARRKGSRSTTR